MNLPWLRAAGDDVILSLHIQPGAKRSELAGQHGEALKIRLAAPPVEGRANDCLIAFLAERLSLPKARVELVAGTSARSKRVRLYGVTTALVVARLSC